ncbi:aspartate/glutamate racemase family protein [Streptomyces daliensis]
MTASHTPSVRPLPSSPAPGRHVGVIRVLTSDDPAFVDAHGRALEERYGFATVSRCIPDQPHGIHSDRTADLAEPKIERLAREMADGGAAVLIVSCAADPALERARAAVTVPVIGAGSSAAAVALAMGGRIGVLGITDTVPPAVMDVLGDRFVGHLRPEGVHDTTALLTEEGGRAAVRAARQLVEDAGADVLVLACTGMATIGLGPRLLREWGIRSVDPVAAAGLFASFALTGFLAEGPDAQAGDERVLRLL